MKTRKTAGKWQQRKKVRMHELKNIIVDRIGKGGAPAAVVLPDREAGEKEKEDKRR